MKEKASMGIKGKLLGASFVALVAIATLAAYSNFAMQKLSANVDFLGSQRLPLMESLGSIRSSSNGAPRYMWLSLAYAAGSADRAKALTKVEQHRHTLAESLKTIGGFDLLPESREQCNRSSRHLRAWTR